MHWFEIIAAEAGEGGGAPDIARMLIPMALIIGVFYFLVLRPQRKKDRDRRGMLETLEKNQSIVTIGGIYGSVQSVRENTVTIRVADNTVLKMRRSAISRILTNGDDDKED